MTDEHKRICPHCGEGLLHGDFNEDFTKEILYCSNEECTITPKYQYSVDVEVMKEYEVDDIHELTDTQRLIPRDTWKNRSFGIECGECKKSIPFDVRSRLEKAFSSKLGYIDFITREHDCRRDEE